MKRPRSSHLTIEIQSPSSSSPAPHKQKSKNITDVSVTPKTSLIIARAVERMRIAEGEKIRLPPPHIEEFVGLMFRLVGHSSGFPSPDLNATIFTFYVQRANF